MKQERKIGEADEMKEHVQQSKHDLASTTFLSFPNSDLSLALCADASDSAIGAVGQQYEDNGWKPTEFYSKKPNDTQKNYSADDKELLGIYFSIKHSSIY